MDAKFPVNSIVDFGQGDAKILSSDPSSSAERADGASKAGDPAQDSSKSQ